MLLVNCRRNLPYSFPVYRRKHSGLPMDKVEEPAGRGSISNLVMQIVVRRDLPDAQGWGVGPLMAQAAHAATAILHQTKDLDDTKAYLSDIPNMRKIIFQISDESSLTKFADALSSADPAIPYYLWTEQPENVPTCLAFAPNRRESRIKKALDKAGCRLWKG